jgi:predicted transposase/invertase (TIGR01784 family)
MTKQDHPFTFDIVFKMVFVQYPKLLKSLTAALLDIQCESIEQFSIMNSEIPPKVLLNKFCRLDINLIVNGLHVDIEVQDQNQGNFLDRTLYYWARLFSSALNLGHTI